MADEAVLERLLQRERRARKEAEELLEVKAMQLYQTNEALRELARGLEKRVKSRTRELELQQVELMSALEAMPRWMNWIESVVTTPDDPDLTDWTLAAQGFRFHWKARITQRVEAQQLHWESVGGLATKGAVRLYPQGANATAVKLSVSYELPGVLAPLMEPTILGGIVTKELQANLDRFRDLVESGYGQPSS